MFSQASQSRRYTRYQIYRSRLCHGPSVGGRVTTLHRNGRPVILDETTAQPIPDATSRLTSLLTGPTGPTGACRVPCLNAIAVGIDGDASLGRPHGVGLLADEIAN